MRRFRLAPEARQDIRGIWSYIACDSVQERREFDRRSMIIAVYSLNIRTSATSGKT